MTTTHALSAPDWARPPSGPTGWRPRSNRWADWLRHNDTQRFRYGTKQGWDTFVHQGPRAPLEVLSRAEMACLDEEELEDYTYARRVWNANPPVVKTTQLSTAFTIIDQVMASNYRDADKLCGSVVIDAAAGLGKTTIATRYARQFHRAVYRRYGPVTDTGAQRLPVAFIQLPQGITLKGLNLKLLEFYGHPAAIARTTSPRLGTLAVDCVHTCETRLIVIDDVHFVDYQRRDGKEISNHLKGLANEMPATFIYVGVNLRARKFFDEGLSGPDATNSQMSRRATRCEVAPFTISTDAGARAWNDLLAALEQHLKLADAHPGMLTDHATLLHRRTQGHLASLTTLLERACHRAIQDGTETLTGDLLASTRIDNAAESLSDA